ncbi:MAG: hypothetical protein HYT09_02545 [Candidatus Levybacteria bacterium]|nr:hypothetical protein [Candidatus Levybacteria bacterium]
MTTTVWPTTEQEWEALEEAAVAKYEPLVQILPVWEVTALFRLAYIRLKELEAEAEKEVKRENSSPRTLIGNRRLRRLR